jgi:hypothetical protein
MDVDPQAHPPFCDPRLCRSDGRYTDHQEEPHVLELVADEASIAISLGRSDEWTVDGDLPGPVRIHLDLATITGEPADGAVLTADETRRAAAALIAAADRCDAAVRATSVTA